MEKVCVDKDICIGCGFCAANLDEVFVMDDDDLATTKDNIDFAKNEDEIKDIAEGCPTGAIKIDKK